MPETPNEFYKRARAIANQDGRLPIPMYVAMPSFPYDGEFQVKPLHEPMVPEPPRQGASGTDDCYRCQHPDDGVIWSDDRWLLATQEEPSGLPVAIMVQPREHLDSVDLDDDRAAEMGRLLVHLQRAIEGLDGIARAHIAKWGDGHAHLFVFVYARPEGFAQLRGATLTLWEDILPPLPPGLWQLNHKAVADALAASYGGTVRIQATAPGTSGLSDRLSGNA